ncbi:MAG: TIGR02444 family protein [Legionellales bacterium]|nr:TIGR02444 family protein [Legionellales bacterium]
MSHSISMTDPFPEHPFWRFSCLVYQDRSLKSACLNLQDHLDMNVNIILFGCWLAANGRGRLQTTDFTKLEQLIAIWHQSITSKLRQFRQQLGRQVAANDNFNLISAVQQEELSAEHVEQLMLAQRAASILPRTRTGIQKACDAANSLQNYAHSLDVNLCLQERQWFADILQVIFNRVSAVNIHQLCGVTQ